MVVGLSGCLNARPSKGDGSQMLPLDVGVSIFPPLFSDASVRFLPGFFFYPEIKEKFKQS